MLFSEDPTTMKLLETLAEQKGISLLSRKEVLLNAKYSSWKTQNYLSVWHILGSVAEAMLIDVVEAIQPSRVIIEVQSVEQFRSIAQDIIAFEEQEAFYFPSAEDSASFLYILSPPYYLIQKWLRMGIPVYTPCKDSEVYTVWGKSLPFGMEKDFPPRSILTLEGKLYQLKSEEKSLRSLFYVDRSYFREVSVPVLKMEKIPVRLCLQPGHSPASPSLWLSETPEPFRKILGETPQKVWKNFQGGILKAEKPLYLFLLSPAVEKSVSQYLMQTLRREARTYYSFRTPHLYVLDGYVLKPGVPRNALEEAFWESGRAGSSLVLVEPGKSDGKISLLRISLSDLQNGEELVSFFVESQEQECHILKQKISEESEKFWADFLLETRPKKPIWRSLWQKILQSFWRKKTPENTVL